MTDELRSRKKSEYVKLLQFPKWLTVNQKRQINKTLSFINSEIRNWRKTK